MAIKAGSKARPAMIAVILIIGLVMGHAMGHVMDLVRGLAPRGALAQAPNSPGDAAKGTFLLTIFLRHDQSKTLDQINQHLKESGYFKKFPPEGIEVVSWYVMMGIGQVVTLRIPAERLREVNRVIEESAWGGYRTEFYPTYDYNAIAAQQRGAAAK